MNPSARRAASIAIIVPGFHPSIDRDKLLTISALRRRDRPSHTAIWLAGGCQSIPLNEGGRLLH
jgi:hypothetical protein